MIDLTHIYDVLGFALYGDAKQLASLTDECIESLRAMRSALRNELVTIDANVPHAAIDVTAIDFGCTKSAD